MTLAGALNPVDVSFSTNVHHFHYVVPCSRTYKTSLFQMEESQTPVAEEMACGYGYPPVLASLVLRQPSSAPLDVQMYSVLTHTSLLRFGSFRKHILGVQGQFDRRPSTTHRGGRP